MGVFGSLFGGGVRSVKVAQARELVDDGAAMVDVRTTQEWNAGHPPFAVHVPLEAMGRASRLPKSKPVVVVCRSGSRSRQACKTLSGMGYEVVNLSGGLAAWRRAGQPLVDRNGRPGGLI